MSTEAKCVGLHWLFDSIHPLDHLEARELCLSCPALEWCQQQRDALREGGSTDARYSLSGTWAGQLYGAPPDAVRLLREEQAFTEDEARQAHLRFFHGDRDDRTKVGERVYQRRIARNKRHRTAAA